MLVKKKDKEKNCLCKCAEFSEVLNFWWFFIGNGDKEK